MRVDHKYASADCERAMYVHSYSQLKLQWLYTTWPHTEPKHASSKTQKGDDERGPIAALGLHPVVSRVEKY